MSTQRTISEADKRSLAKVLAKAKEAIKKGAPTAEDLYEQRVSFVQSHLSGKPATREEAEKFVKFSNGT